MPLCSGSWLGESRERGWMQDSCDGPVCKCFFSAVFQLFPDELERTTELVCIGVERESLRHGWHASEQAGCWCVGAQASGVQVASFWPGLFVSAMQGQDMAKLVCSLPDGGSGGGGGGGGDAAPAAAAAGKAPEGEPDDLNSAWRARQLLHVFGLFSSTFIDCALLVLHAPLLGACPREWTLAGTYLLCSQKLGTPQTCLLRFSFAIMPLHIHWRSCSRESWPMPNVHRCQARA